MGPVEKLNALLDLWTHGTRGFLVLYVLVAIFSLAGLKRGRATLGQYVLWPFTTLPTMVVVGLATELIFWALERFAGMRPGQNQILPGLLIIMIGGFLGGLYWSSRGRPLTGGEKRGAMVIGGEQAQLQTRRLVKQAGRQGYGLITLAGVAVPFEDEVKHFKLLGTTGTGKSTALREVVHKALSRGDRAIIADPDGGYLSRFYDPKRGDVILNPFDARSAKWDLFAELKNAYDADELAQGFIPDRGHDPTWPAFARTLFGAIVAQAQVANITDTAELYRLLVSAEREELGILVKGTAAAPYLAEGSEKLFQGARSTMTTAVKPLDFIRRQMTPLFSVREWIKTGRGVLFLPYQADQIASLKGMISVWLRLAIFQALSMGEEDQRLWFAIDELDALGPINGLQDALTRLRKVGGRCLIGLQSIAQASTTYGSGPAQTIIENCGNSLVLRCSTSEGGGTARYASTLIGQREVLRQVRSVSRSSGASLSSGRDSEGHTEQIAVETAVMPAEIEQLPDRTGYLKFASQPGWMRVEFPVYDLPKVAQSFVPRS